MELELDASPIIGIDSPWENLKVIHIDQLICECGMFTWDTELNNGYGCRSAFNTETPGCCYDFSCPIATTIDEEDPEWNDTLEEGMWMKVYAKFQDTGNQP